MPRFSTPQTLWQWIVLILAVVAVIFLRLYGKGDTPGSTRTSRSTPKAEGNWERLTGCRLVDDRGNDGDSFKLECAGEQHVIRLYYADCPEKYRHEHNGERLAEQGAYFGGLTEEQTIAAGVRAKEYAHAFLQKGPLTVETRWEPVYDSGRYFAYVSVSGQDLGEALVREGLARIHTKGVERMDGTTNRAQRDRLYKFEREAKAARRGAWAGAGVGPGQSRPRKE